LRVCFESLIELFEYLSDQLMKMTQRVKELSQSAKYRQKLKLLGSVVGIGTLIAMEILVELRDVERVKRADELASSFLYWFDSVGVFHGAVCSAGEDPPV